MDVRTGTFTATSLLLLSLEVGERGRQLVQRGGSCAKLERRPGRQKRMGGEMPAPVAPAGKVTENHRAAVFTRRDAPLLTFPVCPSAPEHLSREDFGAHQR